MASNSNIDFVSDASSEPASKTSPDITPICDVEPDMMDETSPEASSPSLSIKTAACEAALDGMDEQSFVAQRCLCLTDMPEEILEHILSFLSPYGEMEMAKQVSKQWNRVIKSTVKQKRRKFYHSLAKCDIQWTEIYKDKPPSYSEKGHIGISDRFSHSAVYHNGFMYVFGGCTSTSTTFNDLWSFDLTHRRWIRPVAMGTYPSPKACATMVVYDGNLVLYGGWSHPIPYPLHQSAHYFSELHVYSPTTNRWAHIHSLGQEPEALGGHSASVVGHLMVVFGGSPRPGMGTNNLWVFDFLKTSWTLQPVARDAVPEPRYGQYQTTLDDKHILIMGGCVGQNRVYTDVWLLTLDPSAPWRWMKLAVENPELGAPQTWCHAACRVDNMITVVAKSNNQRHTRQVKKAKRKRDDPSRRTLPTSPLSSSSSSSPSTSPMNGSETVEGLCAAGPSGTIKIQGVYVHPKLQPQPKRGEAMRQENSAALGTNAGRSGEEEETLSAHMSSRKDLIRPGSNHTSMMTTSSAELPPLPSQGSEISELSSSQYQAANSGRSAAVTSSATPHNSLLALQQRLHRECLNLPDLDNHHYIRRRSGGTGPTGWRGEGALGRDDDEDNEAVPEGYFHRLHNRWLEGQGAAGERGASGNIQQPSSSQMEPSSSSSGSAEASGSAAQNNVRDISETSGATCHFSSVNQSVRTTVHPTLCSKSQDTENLNSSSSQQGLASAQLHQHQQQKHFQPFRQSHPQSPGQGSSSRLMPSIRPNATSNRQRQLEALQRQEELLRSKSRSLAAARSRQAYTSSSQQENQPPQQRQQQHGQNQNDLPHHREDRQNVDPQPQDPQEVERGIHLEANYLKNGNKKGHIDNEDDHDMDDDGDDEEDPSAPILIPSKNKMDVHILDISNALTSGVVRWGPLSELQPCGAPDETICCSLVEGRGELALFGGVRRDMSGSGMGPGGVSNMAVSRLYLLHPG
ncbi:F-box only protein 42 [Plakobranchus ocellatus]|uniref:F-box only protein 42 n=1 Tax=Plakobranchus ocellatus TaxID=259542 RepID=A0AAV3XZ28_9GAST|nr:F-box only protein 42 [Plakobranchus ocellatus]